MQAHLEVDMKGLAKLQERDGLAWIARELLSNAWDSQADSVAITLEATPGKPRAALTVTDSCPEGFHTLTHAWTLFAESTKKGDPGQRGRFNLGEKLVVAHCVTTGGSLRISTTKGTVTFDEKGRHQGRAKRDQGTQVVAEFRCTRAQLDDIRETIHECIPPIPTTLDGQPLVAAERERASTISVSLPTVLADEEGVLRQRTRTTDVHLYKAEDGEGTLYELGVPVVTTGDTYDYDVRQKVPLNMDRDNVTPAYLQKLRVAALNATHQQLNEEQATQPWVSKAAGDDDATRDAVKGIRDTRFGEDAVNYDPSDPEANARAFAQGLNVITGGALSAEEHEQIRKHGLNRPSGQVFPSPRVYSDKGNPERVVGKAQYTAQMERVARWAAHLGRELLGIEVSVRLVREPGVFWGANYGDASLCINVPRCGDIFKRGSSEDQFLALNDLLLHEFGHQYSGDHLSTAYSDALTSLGSKFGRVMWQRGAAGIPSWDTTPARPQDPQERTLQGADLTN